MDTPEMLRRNSYALSTTPTEPESYKVSLSRTTVYLIAAAFILLLILLVGSLLLLYCSALFFSIILSVCNYLNLCNQTWHSTAIPLIVYNASACPAAASDSASTTSATSTSTTSKPSTNTTGTGTTAANNSSTTSVGALAGFSLLQKPAGLAYCCRLQE